MSYFSSVLRIPRRSAQDAGRQPPWLPGVRPVRAFEPSVLDRPRRPLQVPPAAWGTLRSVFGEALPRLACSARGCHGTAVWALRWNNPRLHPPERRKTWLACQAHRGELEAYLSTRGLLREVGPIGDAAEGLPEGPR